MALWAVKRRMIYGGSVLFVALVVLVAISWHFLYKAPECNDGVQNGDEKGIDCGGSCNTICTNDTLVPVVLWAKTFNISGDVYSAVAYIENPNINSENKEAKYKFDIYDAQKNLITTKEGVVSIPKNKKFAVFETGLVLKNLKPRTTNFQFTSFGPWQKNTTKEPEISVSFGEVTSTSTTPNLAGKVTNKSLQDIPKVELSVFIYDNKENVVAASKTFVENLVRNETQDFFFTWPKPFNIGVEACSVPVDLAIALDRSGSMASESKNPPEPFTTVVSTAQNFIKNLTSDDQVSVVSFGTNSKQESLLSSNKDSAVEAIKNLSLGTTTEQTNITGGLTDALNGLKSPSARSNSKKVVILLTDGIPTEPKSAGIMDYPITSAQAVAKEIGDSGIIIYTIGLGKDVSDAFLKSVSSDESHYFLAPTKETLAGIYKKISSDICAKKPNVINVIYRFQ